MRFDTSITTLILVTTMAFGTVQGQETDQAADPAATASEDARPGRNHDRPERQPISDEDRAARRDRYENMSDEEKQALREKMQARKGERRARWDAMSEEDRQAARGKMQQHRDGKDRPRPAGRGRPGGAPDAS